MPLKRLDISPLRSALPGALPHFLVQQRWFGGKARTITSAQLADLIVLPGEPFGFIAIVEVSYGIEAPETYALPFVLSSGETSAGERPQSPALELNLGPGAGRILLFDGLWQKEFCRRLFETIAGSQEFPGEQGRVAARASGALPALWNRAQGDLDPEVLRGEQSNTSVSFSRRLILKIFRKLEPGMNPDLEIGAFLTEKTSFAHVPRVAGWLEYRPQKSRSASLGILQEFVPNHGDAWKFTLAELSGYFERASDADLAQVQSLLPKGSLMDSPGVPPPPKVKTWIGSYFADAALLARRTAGLHQALASDASDPDFAPELATDNDRAKLAQGMSALMERVFSLLRSRRETLNEATRLSAENVLAYEAAIRGKFTALEDGSLNFVRTRIHGDYHLGQVLRTENDFVIIDFEGEPARPLAERRAKRTPLQDVAGMVRSFHYAAAAGLARLAGIKDDARTETGKILSLVWYRWITSVFLDAYFEAASGASFLPRERRTTSLLLESFLLEKAIYELGYELNNRPDWVQLPLQGILGLLAKD